MTEAQAREAARELLGPGSCIGVCVHIAGAAIAGTTSEGDTYNASGRTVEAALDNMRRQVHGADEDDAPRPEMASMNGGIRGQCRPARHESRR